MGIFPPEEGEGREAEPRRHSSDPKNFEIAVFLAPGTGKSRVHSLNEACRRLQGTVWSNFSHNLAAAPCTILETTLLLTSSPVFGLKISKLSQGNARSAHRAPWHPGQDTMV